MTTSSPSSDVDASARTLIVWAVFLCASTLAFRVFTDAFLANPLAAQSSGLIALGLSALGLLFVAAIAHLGSRAKFYSKGKVLLAVLAFGLVMRLIWIGSEPIFETDFYRYLWDGALVANGINPYAHSPFEVLLSDANPGSALALQQGLLAQNPTVNPLLNAINHGHLATVYPPVAQVFFAIAHWIAPYQAWGLQLVWLGIDLLSLGLLLWLLDLTKQSKFWVTIYWWNPLLIEETINSLHMDVLLLPFLSLALIAALTARTWLVSAALALAAGVKVWPLILWPAFAILPKHRSAWPRHVAWGLATLAITALIYLPIYLFAAQNLDQNSGFLAYAKGWEMNDALFMAAKGTLHQGLGIELSQASQLTRYLLALILVGLSLSFWSGLLGPKWSAAQAGLVITATLFMLSPTQFPWYYIWIFPFILIYRVWPLIWLTALLPIYYWRYQATAQDWSQWFHQGLVWVEFGPVILGLMWLAWQKIRHSKSLTQ